MILFDCECTYRFIVGKKRVYGPIYPIELQGHFAEVPGCHSRGRMMTRTQHPVHRPRLSDLSST